jgi:hypothetical protein
MFCKFRDVVSLTQVEGEALINHLADFLNNVEEPEEVLLSALTKLSEGMNK